MIGIEDLPSSPPGRCGWPWTEETGRPRSEAGGQRTDGTWPRISIVTPSFNQGAFIEATIRSVLLQGYPNLEYMVIDGGSTDESIGAIRRYEPWISHWVSEQDRGQSEAINKGLRRATGDVVSYLNSDDLLEPGALGRVADEFASHPETDLVYGGYTFIDANGRVLREFMPPEFDRAQLFLGDFLGQPAVFMRRSCLDRLGGFDEMCHYAMDYDMWLRASMAGARFVRCARPIARMRLHSRCKSVALEHLFQAEVQTTLKRIISGGELPPDVAEAAPGAMGNSCFIEAMSHAGAGDMSRAVDACERSLAHYDLYGMGRVRGFIRRWAAMDMLGRLVPVALFHRRIMALTGADAPDDTVRDCIDFYSEAFRERALNLPLPLAALEVARGWRCRSVRRWAVKDAAKKLLSKPLQIRQVR